jgi:UDP-glucose 4-epimerase
VVGDTGDPALVARIIAEHGVTDIIHFATSIAVPDWSARQRKANLNLLRV